MPKFLATVLLGLIFWSPVQSATIQLNGSGTAAIGILNLDINGTSYDVVFEFVNGSIDPFESYVACGGGVPCDAFAGDATGAEIAVVAIDNFLNTYNAGLNAGEPKVEGVGSTADDDFLVPYKIGMGCKDFCAWRGVYNTVIWSELDSPDIVENAIKEYARFSPASPIIATPLPPSVLMFASGLGLLGWLQRRKPVLKSS